VIEEAIAALAEQHGGYVRHEALLALGLTRDGIKHRLARGLLIPEFNRVYAVGHRPTNPIDRAHGVLLACGERSALSHGSGGALLEVVEEWPSPYHVSTSLDRRPRGIVTHHRPALLRADVVVVQGLRVTAPALIALDLAPTLSRKRLVRLVNELRLGHGLEPDELEDLLERFPRHPGARTLRDALGLQQAEPTRSGFEDDWIPFAVRHHLSGWTMNVHVGRHRVDVLFAPDLLVVQLDGYPTHSLPVAVEDDKEQDAEILEEFGIPTIRITRRQFRADPDRQAERIRRVLATRRAADPHAPAASPPAAPDGPENCTPDRIAIA
jgi:very-short-patch-repair endonuclease